MSKRAIDPARLLCGAAALALIGASSARAQTAQTYNIPPKSLAAALNDFAAQSHEPILATGDLVSGKSSPGASGQAEAAAVLSRLLEGTGLTYRRSGRTFLIIKASTTTLPITRIADQTTGPTPTASVASVQLAQQSAQPSELGEVVVTATRQTSTVNKVALSITAVTQGALDRQGVENIDSLARNVPSLTFRKVGNEGNPQVAIRGIISNLGASTTGIYLDDTPLQKRGTNGAVTGNGSPTPVLFDLDRIEVLRGPQGTLFGSGSEGGTVRFITPAPSLTRYSAYGRAEVSTTEGGGASYGGGVGVGGPIVADKLGFRLSVYDKHIGGVLDHVSIYDGHTVASNTDFGDQKALHLALAWQATSNLRITPSLYISSDSLADQGSFWQNVPRFTTQGGTFTNKTRVGDGASVPGSTGFNLDFPDATLPGFSFGPYPFFGVNKTPVNFYYDQNCGSCTAYTPFGPSQINIAATTINGVVYPAHSINIPGQQPGPNSAKAALSPRVNTLTLPTLTFDYQARGFLVKSITSFARDNSEGYNGGQFGGRASFLPTTTTPATALGGQYVNPNGTPVAGGATGAPLNPSGLPPLAAPGTGGNFIVIPGTPFQYSNFYYVNRRDQWTQEVRFSSDNSPGDRLSWVGGLYFSDAKQYQRLSQPASEATTSYNLRGIDESFTLNAYNIGATTPIPVSIACNPNPTGAAPNQTYSCVQTAPTTGTTGDVARRYVHIHEQETAAFGEANYMITEKLKATAGVRVARSMNTYLQDLSGSVFGDPLSPVFVATPPTAANPGGNPLAVAGQNYVTTTSGSQAETPVTPKFGLSYQIDPTDMVYATVAKGYRPGGVNAPVSQGNCAAQLAALNITGSPIGYNSDTVISYEAGAKVRLLGAQINSSLFYIDWKNPQLTVQLTCGSSYITNAGAARSQGFDTQIQTRRFFGFSFNGSLAYTDAKYTQDVTNATPTGPPSYIVHKDDPLPISKWQFAVGIQYDTTLFDKYGAYVRADYDFSGSYLRNLANSTSYDPITAVAAPTHFTTMRAGVNVGPWDMNVFVNNLTNSQDLLVVGHGAGAAQVTAQTFRPREVGLQATFRY
ncbi:MAG: TonB-dependent receptor [Caulobacteraceae bacterium]|nr:TonB-dependent receptor [Caulobacteraceae bacterium]